MKRISLSQKAGERKYLAKSVSIQWRNLKSCNAKLRKESGWLRRNAGEGRKA